MHHRMSTAPTVTSSPILASLAPAATEANLAKTPPKTPTTKKHTNDKDSQNSTATLLASLLNSAAKSSTPLSLLKQKSTAQHVAETLETLSLNKSSESRTPAKAPPSDHVVLRTLESWHDENEQQLDDSRYQELADSSNGDGWSADEMFKYNEKRHNITSSYTEKTLSGNYTTPLSKNKSKTAARMATQLAKEIEKGTLAKGRVTPESSDDDEIFDQEQKKRMTLKQQKQLDQLRNLKFVHDGSLQTKLPINSHDHRHTRPLNSFSVATSLRKSNRTSSQHSNSSATPATASVSSSPLLNDSATINIKPVTSSSRNILRTCLI